MKKYGSISTDGKAFLGDVHKMLNPASLCSTIFVPWLFFCAMFALSGMKFRHNYYAASIVFLFWIALVLAFVFVWAFQTTRGRMLQTWHMPMVGSLIVAWVLGVTLGDVAYRHHYRTHYELMDMPTYSHVDAGHITAKKIEDAGMVTFREQTTLGRFQAYFDLEGKRYCVAQLVSNKPPTADGVKVEAKYWDMFAFGTNCCSDYKKDAFGRFTSGFNCGGVDGLTEVRHGVRVLDEKTLQLLKESYSQAPVWDNMPKSSNPLFFNVESAEDYEDSLARPMIDKYYKHGIRFYMISMLGFLTLQLGFAGAMTYQFHKNAVLP